MAQSANANKTDAEVIIDGKVYTLRGYESEEYLQKIASYLNSKSSEFKKSESYGRLTTDYRNILMQINIADDYLRLQKEYEAVQEELEAREKDLYDLKHEIIATQMKLETTEKNLQESKKEAEESSRRIIRLETEIKTRMEDLKK